MGRKRGFFAELQHQQALAERSRQRAQAAAVRDQAARQREAERTRAAELRARQLTARTDAQAAKDKEREAKRLHVEAQEAQAESLNATLQLQLWDIDNILSATLAVDDFVDLEKLKTAAKHPPFSSKHSRPIPPPATVEVPPEPVFVAPAAPTGLSSLFGKKKHAEAVATARTEYEDQHRQWQQYAASVPMKQLAQLSEHKKAEEVRLEGLARDQAKYEGDCQQRQADVDASNAQLDLLIADFAAGKRSAIEDYIGIVIGNSIYPENFPWAVEYEFDEKTKELEVQLEFPTPEQLPTARQYKYVKAKDEIVETAQTQKEQRDRYSNVVENMTLRTLHEIWESDRGGKVASISLTGGVQHIDPAVGREKLTPLVAVAVAREAFLGINLSKVTPSETLKHLGAVVTKNPWALTAIDTSDGVRGL